MITTLQLKIKDNCAKIILEFLDVSSIAVDSNSIFLFIVSFYSINLYTSLLIKSKTVVVSYFSTEYSNTYILMN